MKVGTATRLGVILAALGMVGAAVKHIRDIVEAVGELQGPLGPYGPAIAVLLLGAALAILLLPKDSGPSPFPRTVPAWLRAHAASLLAVCLALVLSIIIAIQGGAPSQPGAPSVPPAREPSPLRLSTQTNEVLDGGAPIGNRKNAEPGPRISGGGGRTQKRARSVPRELDGPVLGYLLRASCRVQRTPEDSWLTVGVVGAAVPNDVVGAANRPLRVLEFSCGEAPDGAGATEEVFVDAFPLGKGDAEFSVNVVAAEGSNFAVALKVTLVLAGGAGLQPYGECRLAEGDPGTRPVLGRSGKHEVHSDCSVSVKNQPPAEGELGPPGTTTLKVVTSCVREGGSVAVLTTHENGIEPYALTGDLACSAPRGEPRKEKREAIFANEVGSGWNTLRSRASIPKGTYAEFAMSVERVTAGGVKRRLYACRHLGTQESIAQHAPDSILSNFVCEAEVWSGTVKAQR